MRKDWPVHDGTMTVTGVSDRAVASPPTRWARSSGGKGAKASAHCRTRGKTAMVTLGRARWVVHCTRRRMLFTWSVTAIFSYMVSMAARAKLSDWGYFSDFLLYQLGGVVQRRGAKSEARCARATGRNATLRASHLRHAPFP